MSKYGPVPGVGYSCRKSVRKRRELAADRSEISTITTTTTTASTLILYYIVWVWLMLCINMKTRPERIIFNVCLMQRHTQYADRSQMINVSRIKFPSWFGATATAATAAQTHHLTPTTASPPERHLFQSVHHLLFRAKSAESRDLKSTVHTQTHRPHRF